ncbi:hypothetical protein PTTG_26839 [Puccinia triticina 1-1 BBBD Race 1]|uniref:Uncharacterized protein n=1 Tax=Puccinia triticina (isolate 1-1 / race 1 (BBBD)) TaxID=630390 RepID=A0A180GR18_PUCT1|nr:hypothetical protein PTTG_26839 [Puccinia triticina 1-1 BBBD Race 1]
MSVLDWNEAQVNQFFISLGLNRFEPAIREHALTGDVLIHLDNELLKDIGIQSVGKRLTILKAIYKLKLKEDIPIEDGHWTPPLGDLEQEHSEPDTHSDASPILATPPANPHPPARQRDSISLLRDQRIKNLESDVRSIKQELHSLSARFLSLASTPNSPSAAILEPIPRTGPTRAQDRHMREESICQLDIHDPSPVSPAPSHTNPTIPSSHEDPKPSQPPSPALSSTTNPSQEILYTQPFNQDQSPTKEVLKISTTPKPAERPVTKSEKQTLNLNSVNSNNTNSLKEKEESSKAREASNPYKSFRVTLEDPCYKVLPAALKKYKINEHYKNYVLFICYGKQERCLSYEEKPLLLFQKLKEANQNPVFTLRHIKDIESPVCLALAKQAQRREKKLASAALKLAEPTTSSSTQQSKKSPPNTGRVEKASGFCIAIYPYMSECEDDLDVGVGDTFIIVGKSKGWWVVNRDKGTETELDEGQQGWIPSGCLLETRKSFSMGPSGKADYTTPIRPEDILSVSSSCYGLMDYKSKGVDELGFEIKDRLKVYKKYNNWSYAINESKPEKPRGWTPSWLIGTRKDKDAGPPASPERPSKPSTTSATPSVGGAPSMGLVPGSSADSAPTGAAPPGAGKSRPPKPALASSAPLFDRYTHHPHLSSRSSSSTTLSTVSDATTTSTTTVTPATSVFASASHKLPSLNSSASSSSSLGDDGPQPAKLASAPLAHPNNPLRNSVRLRNRNSRISNVHGLKDLRIDGSNSADLPHAVT